MPPMHNAITDEILIARLAKGEISSLGELYRRHVGMVESAVKRFAPHANASEVEDIAHDVFLKLDRAAKGYQENAKFKAWLYGVAVRTAKSWKKKHAIRNRLFNSHKMVPEEDNGLRSSPERNTALKQLVERLFSRLPKRQQDVLFLYEAEGFTAKEIAEIMNLSEQAVWTRVHRARQILLRAFDKADVDAALSHDLPHLYEVTP